MWESSLDHLLVMWASSLDHITFRRPKYIITTITCCSHDGRDVLFSSLLTIDLLLLLHTMMATYTINTSQHAIDLLPFSGRDPTVTTTQLRDHTVITVEPQFTKQIYFNKSIAKQNLKFFHIKIKTCSFKFMSYSSEHLCRNAVKLLIACCLCPSYSMWNEKCCSVTGIGC